MGNISILSETVAKPAPAAWGGGGLCCLSFGSCNYADVASWGQIILVFRTYALLWRSSYVKLYLFIVQ